MAKKSTRKRNSKSSSTQFPIRLLWGTTPEQRQMAHDIGCNWATVYTCGHRRNDFPFYFDSDPKIAALRKKESRAEVEQEKKILRDSVDHAHELGLKAMIHSYEVSIPEEFRQLYPRLYRPHIKEYRDAAPEVRIERGPCPADPRVREIISQKVADTLANVPDVDAYAFCLNECLSGTNVRHRCENCRDIPHSQMIKWVADAVHDGITSFDARIRFFHRMWGINEHDDMYHENYGRRWRLQEGYGKRWLGAIYDTRAADHLHYKPSRDLPEYIKMQKNVDMGFVVKGTWADISLEHPLNPWIKKLTDHDTIVELSWENTNIDRESFHLLAHQFQRMAQYARKCGANGLGGMPCAWGYKPNHHGTGGHDGGGRPWIGKIDDDHHKLGMLNFNAFQAVTKNPDVDMQKVIADGLAKRYGKKLPQQLVDYVLESQKIKARTNNCRGVQCSGQNIERMYYQMLRYGPTVKNWKEKLSLDPDNIERIINENQRNMKRASAVVEDLKQYKGKILDKAYDEFMHCFTALRDRAHAVGKRQNLNFLLWAVKDGTIKPHMGTMMKIEQNIPPASPGSIES